MKTMMVTRVFDGIFKLIFGITALNFKTKLKMEVPCLGD